MASTCGSNLLTFAAARSACLCPRVTKTINSRLFKSTHALYKRSLSGNNQFIGRLRCLTSHRTSLLKSTSLDLEILQKRSFWGVDVAFNKVDKERVRLAGPDRACAEWVLRNGGHIRWEGSERQLTNYNGLPTTDFENYKVEEIDLTGTDVTDLGFNHLENLQHLKVIKLNAVLTIANNSLLHLDYVKDVLEHIEVSQCPQITEQGLQHLHQLTNLKKVLIYDLAEVKDLNGAVSRLKEAMPWCQFEMSNPLTTLKDG